MTKTTLLTAASVAAVLIAGGAQAGVMTATVGTTPVTATATAPFTIASERTNANDTTVAGGFTAINTLPTNITVTAGTTQNYRVSFTFVNGVPSAPTLTANSTGNTPTADTTYAPAGVVTTGTSTVVTYIVTVNAPANQSGPPPVSGDRVINNFRLNVTLANSSAEGAVSVASRVELLAGGVPTDVDTTAATTLVTYAAAIGGFSVTSNNALASLPSFLFFRQGAAPAAPISGAADPAVAGTGSAAELASNFSLVATPTTTLTFAGNTFYAGLGGAAPSAVTADTILNGGTIVVSGGSQLNSLVPSMPVTAGLAPVARTATTATFTLDNTAGDTLFAATPANRPDFLLTQNATPVAIQATNFNAVFTPTAANGYTLGGASASTPSGNIALDGVTFIAPWISGSQNVSQSVVRVTNDATVASGPITLRLGARYVRAAGVTTGQGVLQPAVTCSAIGGQPISVPAGGTLQIGGGELQACFGDFLTGDLQVTVQSSSTQLTAKARTVRSDGTFETSLGRFGAPESY